MNSTENNNHCKSKEIIDSHISGTFFSLLAKDIGLDPSNFSDPIIPTLQSLHTTIDKTFFRDFVLYFGITQVQTDVGLFKEKIIKKNYMNFIKTTQAFYNRYEKLFYKGESMCEIQFKLGDDIRVQKRSFMKMTEVFAITGGYMQLISTIFKIISVLNNKLSYEIKLVNDLFNIYPKEKKIKLKINKKLFFSKKNKNSKINYYPNDIKNINYQIDKKIDEDKFSINEYVMQSFKLKDNNFNEYKIKRHFRKYSKSNESFSENNKFNNNEKSSITPCNKNTK